MPTFYDYKRKRNFMETIYIYIIYIYIASSLILKNHIKHFKKEKELLRIVTS